MENREQGKENYKYATVRANVSAMKGHLISLRLSYNTGQMWTQNQFFGFHY